MASVGEGLAEGGAPQTYQHGSGAAVGGTSPGIGNDWRDHPVPEEDVGTRGLMEMVKVMNENNMQMINQMMNHMLDKQWEMTKQLLSDNTKENGENKPGNGKRHGRLEGKHYCRMERFGGGDKFRQWAKDIMITTGSQDKELEEAMKHIMRTKTMTSGKELEA